MLALCVLIFEEPDRGRFDIQHSVKNSVDEGSRQGEDGSVGYALSEEATHKKLHID